MAIMFWECPRCHAGNAISICRACGFVSDFVRPTTRLPEPFPASRLPRRSLLVRALALLAVVVVVAGALAVQAL